ncbi:sensor histidine kinase [Altererythrobacter sp. Z27]|uniref:sensor histidine kinase n=1 Tax=Altererythrobacter sp. Z27 TaxID=3461147 RepID=UPI004043E635
MRQEISRWYLPAIAGLAVLLAGLLAMVAVDRAMHSAAMAEAQSVADGDAAILAAGLESELDKFSLLPRVLAVDPEVRALLSGEARQQAVLNRRLADLAEQTGAAAIYLLDADGLTLAASNWELPTSFVGSNYRFRSYFSEAIEKGASNEFALGTISRRPGLYIAQRVQPGSSPLGVVAIKVEFDAIEQNWREAQEGVFVTDPDGVVLITSNPEWRFRTTRASEPSARNPAQDELRFGVSSLELLPAAGEDSAFSSVALIEKIQPIAPNGWELHLLVDPSPRLAAAIANGRLLVLLGLIAAAALGGILIWWLRRREAQAEALLAQRTATLRDQLLQANRLATLGQVTAGLGHEIRQPVAAMRVYAENGERFLAAGQGEAAAENFGKIVGLTARIGQITEELLRFSRRGARTPVEMPLAQAIDGALLLLRDRVERHGVTLVPPDPALAQTMVRGEHVRLEQVLVNLLQNALDATPTGGRIAIEIAVESDRCLLTVADSGTGIDENLREALFQPFATTKEEGLGLGLVISLDIMRSLGGDLRADSSTMGARFTMVIPRT